jgi:hypothetical protein
MCKACDVKEHRRYMRAHPHKNREYNQRDYRKHSRKRIADVMTYYWKIKKDPRRHAAYLAKRREQHHRRVARS